MEVELVAGLTYIVVIDLLAIKSQKPSLINHSCSNLKAGGCLLHEEAPVFNNTV
jgi:hypothetical protein